MPLYLFAHGGERHGDRKTFVPAGVTVHFYARSGELAATPNLVKVLTGTVAGDVSRYTRPRKIRNYHLTPQSDDVLAAAVQVAASPDDVMTVERPMYLCEAPRDQPCVRQHTCTGLFGAMKSGRIRFAANLHILACRGVLGTASKMTETLPGEKKPEFLNQLRRTAAELLRLATVDQAAADAYFDRLDGDTQALLLTGVEPVKAWSYVREATRYLNAVGPLGFLRYWLGQPHQVQEWLSADPGLSAKIQEAENFVTISTHLAPEAWAELPEQDRDNLVHCLAYRGEPAPPDIKSLSRLAIQRNQEVLQALTEQTVPFCQIGPVVALGDGHDWKLMELMTDRIRQTVLKTGSVRVGPDGLVAWYDDVAFDSDKARAQFFEAMYQAGSHRMEWEHPGAR